MTRYEYTDKGGERVAVRSTRVFASTALLSITNGSIYLPADRVEEVCAALREAAGLDPVWTVKKSSPILLDEYTIGVGRMVAQGEPEILRSFAEHLLAAADAAEARANRPKLPTAPRTMVEVGGCAWVRSDADRWTPVEKQGHLVGMDDSAMSAEDFAVLYDPAEVR